jgi:hypothetical protein
MAERLLKLIITKSKQGHSIGQISELTGLTIDQMMETLAQATGLTPADLSIIFHMKQRGLSLDQIRQEYGVELEVLEQFLRHGIRETVGTQIDALADQGKGPYEIGRMLGINERAVLAYALEGESKTNSEDSERAPTYSRSPPTTTEETTQPTKTLSKPQQTPTFLYCCQWNTNKLCMVNLLTGVKSCHEVPSYQFKGGCRWSELPGGSLLITGGGGYYAVRDVEKIDTLREYAVLHQPPMLTTRRSHAAVYHSQYVYALGESECERYSCALSRWEVLPSLPEAGWYMSAVEWRTVFMLLEAIQTLFRS